jgi:hypothetical protein
VNLFFLSSVNRNQQDHIPSALRPIIWQLSSNDLVGKLNGQTYTERWRIISCRQLDF